MGVTVRDRGVPSGLDTHLLGDEDGDRGRTGWKEKSREESHPAFEGYAVLPIFPFAEHPLVRRLGKCAFGDIGKTICTQRRGHYALFTVRHFPRYFELSTCHSFPQTIPSFP